MSDEKFVGCYVKKHFHRFFYFEKASSFVIVFIAVGTEMDKVVKVDQQVTAPPPHPSSVNALLLQAPTYRPVGGLELV